MKKIIENTKILDEEWKVPGIKEKVPVIMIEPQISNFTNTLVIFITGLNGNSSFTKYFNYDCFKAVYLFSYDQRAQSKNKNKASKNYKIYLKDLDFIINEIKSRYHYIEKIILIGESWGSSLAFLYNKYRPNKINGTFGWNMPYKVKDIQPKSFSAKLKLSIKVLLTFLTPIETFDESPIAGALTNNLILKRMLKANKSNKLSNRVVIAAWMTFKKSWRYLICNCNNINFTYIQSGEDVMATDQIINKAMLKSDNFIKFDKGYHILTFDENVSDKLFQKIGIYITKIIDSK